MEIRYHKITGIEGIKLLNVKANTAKVNIKIIRRPLQHI